MIFAGGANDTTMKTTMTTTRKSSKEEARESFIHHVASARELMTLLRRHLDDHMGIGPDEVNWAHVGDAARLAEALKKAARGCNLIEGEE